MIFSVVPAVAGIVGCAAYFSPHAWRLRCVSTLRQRAARDRMLILTYDDGPSSSITPAILEILQHHKAKATFFMLGRSAQQCPRIADRIFEEGHDVGCHSDQHLNAWKVNPWIAVTDINAGYDKLLPWVPQNGIYRPPYGKMTLPTYLALRRRGAPVGWWTIDSGDTHSSLPQPKQVADRLMREGGGVVLMHDLDRSKDRNNFVLEATDLLLNIAEQKSFNIKRLSDLCH